MKTTLVVTFLNEEKSVEQFLFSVMRQTLPVSEVILVDGGSKDSTINRFKAFQKKHRLQNVRLFTKLGNRSVGRNYGIKKATNEIILLADMGCILDKEWVKKISAPFKAADIAVVAGYYKGKATSVFQKCLLPYVLTMPDQINPAAFLPSTRSMAIRKAAWKTANGFPEAYSHNEDYVFAKKLQKEKVKIFFAKTAFVYWIPRETLMQSFIMFYRFALGDAEAGILRGKVVLIYVRYVFFGLLFLMYLLSYPFIQAFSFLIISGYLFWSVTKNYRYINNWQAAFFLPLLQIVSDFAVLCGTSIGFFRLLLTTSVKGKFIGMLQ